MTPAPALTGTDWYLLRGLLRCGWCAALMVADWSDGGRGYRCATACRPARLDAATVEDNVVTAASVRYPGLRAVLHDPIYQHQTLRRLVGWVLVGGEHQLTVIWRT
jgi:hypothetical protein